MTAEGVRVTSDDGRATRFLDAERRVWESFGVEPPHSRRLDLARIGVSVRVQEIGEGPPVLFVHGASNGGTSWASLIAPLGGFRCILLDRPGCGLSDRLTTGFDDVARFGVFAESVLVDVLDALGLERAHLVSTSFGGYLALRSVAAHPDRFGRMIEFGWPMGAPIEKTPMSMRIASLRPLGRLMTAMPVNARAARSLLRNVGLRAALDSGAFTPTMVDWFVSLLRDTDTMRNEVDAGPRIITARHGMNDSVLLPADLLARIQTPVRFVWGRDDPMGGTATARAFAAQIPCAELEMVPGGHAVWIDDAPHAAARTRDFLTSLST